MNKDYVFIWLPFYLTSLLGLLYFLENPCMYPWQFASDGSRCGGRASSIRVDGKNPTEFWFFWSIFFFGSIYLLYRVYLPRLKSFIAGDGLFNKDKKPKFISETPPYNHEEGKFEWDGPWEQRYENGQLMSKGTLNDGKMVGPWIVYYENGNIKREDDYDWYEEPKLRSTYYENGQLQMRGYIKDDYRIGVWESYYENGQLFRKYFINEKDYDGKLMIYFEDGSLQVYQNYKDGKPIGVWKEFFPDGSLKHIVKHKKNEVVSDIEYNENGSISYQIIKTKNGETSKFYKRNGELESWYEKTIDANGNESTEMKYGRDIY